VKRSAGRRRRDFMGAKKWNQRRIVENGEE
jgi:hypothetical protein